MEPTPPRPVSVVPVAQRLRAWVIWFGAGRLVATALSVIAVCAGALWLVRAPSPSAESTLPYAGRSGSVSAGTGGSGASADAASSSAASLPSAPSSTIVAPLVVHVAGQVATPGVYRLASGARVVDAVEIAGGLLPEADVDVINLAAPLADGQRLYVPRVGQTPPAVVTGTGGAATGSAAASGSGATGAATVGGPVAVNSATAEQLDTLPGVGPATAAAIIAYRDEHGPFSSVEQLGEVRGIGPAKLDALRDLVSV